MEKSIEDKYHIGFISEGSVVFRKCRECREIKELNLENFVKRPTENGWRSRCKICYNKRLRFKQEINPIERETGLKYRLKYKKEKPLQTLLKAARSNAKKRFREFNLDIETLIDIWNKQDGLCFYTGRKMRFEVGFPDSVSIDRYNSKMGYLKNNIVLCTKQVNVMKNDASYEELITFAKDVLEIKQSKNL